MYNKNVCVIGAGRWGKNHIRTLHELGCLGGIVDTAKKELILLNEKYPSIKKYRRYEEALNDNYDGYIVATNAQSHFKIAELLLKNKKHVLVEKPLSLNSQDAHILNDLAEMNNVNLMVGHVLLFHPAFQKIKSLLDEGILGDLQYIYIVTA